MSKFGDNFRTICEKTKADVESFAQRLTLDVFSRLIQRSPVDTGRFRANWRDSIDAPDESIDLSARADPTEAIAARLASQKLVGHSAYLTNSLPYALPLEYGWSDQAPSGMVRITVEEAEAILERAAVAARSIA